MASQVLHFPLAPPEAHPYTHPGGPAARARGEFRLRLWADGTGAGLTRAERLRMVNNEGGYYQTWLVADVRVPRRVDPADLEALPRVHPEANRPGSVFTLDGQRPRPLPAAGVPNTVWLAVRAGAWGTDETGRQPGARWFLNDFSNWCFWLPEGWGEPPPPLADDPGAPRDPDAPELGAARGLPSGLALQILTDLFVGRATVLPEVPADPPLARLQALWERRVRPLDSDGDGLLGYRDAVGTRGLFLDPLAFSRVIVTREVPSSATVPRLYPTTAAVVLAGWREGAALVDTVEPEPNEPPADGAERDPDPLPEVPAAG
ncbi:hypothetical protein [Limnochorda pilosa]|uniref:Uncharacterized protein n=1 Tax=Limnochorda pilosa TaxID=1555112 RepID=A0A0K2SQL4_LIMPI|nr:hypothetical protein [Limnochorda pilosa]BAS29420.1 hypothetical protein LIP_3612 [Limnochorda pilosa]